MLSVEILVQAVVIAFSILQQERRRPGLAGAMTAVQESRVVVRVANGDIQGFVPAIGDAAEARIQRRAQAGDEPGQGVGEVFVFAASETMASHHDAAAELLVDLITGSQRRAFFRRQHGRQDRMAFIVEFRRYAFPVHRCDPIHHQRIDRRRLRQCKPPLRRRFHEDSRSSNARLRSTPQR